MNNPLRTIVTIIIIIIQGFELQRKKKNYEIKIQTKILNTQRMY